MSSDPILSSSKLSSLRAGISPINLLQSILPLLESASLPILIAVMGATGSGKTSFINLASGSNLRVGDDLDSCTSEVQLSDMFTLDGQTVLLIDTPGFDDTSKTDTDVLKMIAAFLAAAYEKNAKLAGVIYVHRISDKRFTGLTKRNFRMFQELCGDTTLENVVLVTSMWDEVSRDAGESRENKLSTNSFKSARDKGARMARHHNTERSARDIIRMIMGNRPVVLQIQRELVDQRKEITRTAAGEIINRELNELIRQHEASLNRVQEEMVQALRKREEETRKDLEEQRRELEEEMRRIKENSEGMASRYAEEKQKVKARMKEMEEEAKRERERAQAEFTREIDELKRRLEDMAGASGDERAALEKQIQDLERQREEAKEKGCCVIM